jgi:hypothetical protein
MSQTFGPYRVGSLQFSFDAHAFPGLGGRLTANIQGSGFKSIETMSADELRALGMQAILAADCADALARRKARRHAA